MAYMMVQKNGRIEKSFLWNSRGEVTQSVRDMGTFHLCSVLKMIRKK